MLVDKTFGEKMPEKAYQLVSYILVGCAKYSI